MVGVIQQGGIGNCAFQIGAALAYSLKHNMELVVSKENIHPHLDRPPILFPNIKYVDQLPDLPKYVEPSFNYNEIPYMPEICLVGYFQSFRYIEPYRNEVLKAFGLDDIETKEDFCSIHYRATDYKLYPKVHPVVSQDYLRKAINNMLFSHYRRFMVFSDDILEIRQIIKSFTWLNGIEFEYSEGNDEMTDLKLMASCSSNIIANSSFSLWAAYINPNPKKIVVAPRKWFGEDLPHSTVDLYLPETVIV